MAFEPKQTQIDHALKTSATTPTLPPAQSDFYERKKQYQIMLKPSNREKLDRLAKASGARSASSYLDNLIENMTE